MRYVAIYTIVFANPIEETLNQKCTFREFHNAKSSRFIGANIFLVRLTIQTL